MLDAPERHPQETSMSAAIYFVPDAYILEGHQIMGRRMAGAAFLRAAVEGRGGEPVTAYTSNAVTADLFVKAVQEIDPGAITKWLPMGRHDLLAQMGTLYRPDPSIGEDARLRLRSDPRCYSLCGITHTLLASRIIDGISGFIFEPIMPWDALICTSQVARDVVESTLSDALDYLRWRSGADVSPPLPQLPIIPLGVHSRDWAISETGRIAARKALSISDSEVVILFAGRLSFAAKAHPFQMYAALQAVAEKSGQPITLLLAGQFFNERIEQEFIADAKRHCPRVRYLHVDGAGGDAYKGAFAAADIFVSLADNMQETFGITPLEAMAAGLPVVVSDWNGYRDTVRNGIDGFRIPTWAPGAGSGVDIGHSYEVTDNYDAYSSRTSTTVSVDMALLTARLDMLVRDPSVRRQMGAAGRARVISDFDWGVIYRRYDELWTELGAMRKQASAKDELAAFISRPPKVHPAHADPYHRFSSYPSHPIGPDTIVRAAPRGSLSAYEALVAQPMFSFWQMRPDVAGSIIEAAGNPVSVEALAAQLGRTVVAIAELVARLAKMNLVILRR